MPHPKIDFYTKFKATAYPTHAEYYTDAG